jgi:hypothetical protein
VALSQARILYQNHSGDYPQVILTIPVTCRTAPTDISLAQHSPAQLSAEIVEGIILLQNFSSLLELGPLKNLKSHRKRIGCHIAKW